MQRHSTTEAAIEAELTRVTKRLGRLPLVPLPVTHYFNAFDHGSLDQIAYELKMEGFLVNVTEKEAADDAGIRLIFFELTAKRNESVSPQSLHPVFLKCGEIAQRHNVIYDRIDVDTYLVDDPV